MVKDPLQTLREEGDSVVILDQTRLPRETSFVALSSLGDAAHAIRSMQVRGAPLIGATAAYGVALGLAGHADDARLDRVLAELAATRPTAVNLHWALGRMASVLRPLAADKRRAAAWNEARRIAAEDADANAAIGQHGLPLIEALCMNRTEAGGRQGAGVATHHNAAVVHVMTHCNAGWLATVAHGTALAPVYAAHRAGIPLHVWVSETRPRNQGLLTAWELAAADIPHTLIVDNAAGLLLMQQRVDCVIVGADRIAANGDVANKVGTYLKALAAKAHGIPFYVAAPRSTIDLACPDGASIPIEERSGSELGTTTASANPAFDLTPAGLITAVVTECGIHAPQDIRKLKT